MICLFSKQGRCDQPGEWALSRRVIIQVCNDHYVSDGNSIEDASKDYFVHRGVPISEENWVAQRADKLIEELGIGFPGYDNLDHGCNCAGKVFIRENVVSDKCGCKLMSMAFERAGIRQWRQHVCTWRCTHFYKEDEKPDLLPPPGMQWIFKTDRYSWKQWQCV